MERKFMTTKQIIRQIAKEQGVTPKQVETDMKEAIREAMENTKASGDPVAKELWGRLAPDGKEPSIEKFLNFCAAELHNRRSS